MARFLELRRHTDNDGDVLTDRGVAAALRIGAGLAGGYRLGVSTGAQRATQTLACLLAALGQPVPGGVIVESGLRSQREERGRVVGHSPTNEAAVFGLTGQQVAPVAKGAGVLVVADGDRLRVEPLNP